MPNGHDNTTFVGNGDVGISGEVKSVAGQQIEQAVSESNLNAALNGGDKSLTGLFDATVKMVRKMLTPDKIRLLQEFGSAQNVNIKNEDSLNRALALALIATLPKSELRAIVGKQKTDEVRATQEVKKALSHNKAQIAMLQKNYLTLNKTIESFNNGGENAASASDIAKELGYASGNKKGLSNKKGDFYLEDTIAKNVLPNLEKEILEVLRSNDFFTNAQIAEMANKMKIHYEDGISRRDLTNKIKNMCLHYSVLVLGTSKGITAARFDPDTVNTIKTIFTMTKHFGHLAGVIGMTDSALKIERNRISAAKKKTDEALKQMKAKARVKERDTFVGQALFGKYKVKHDHLLFNGRKTDRKNTKANVEKLREEIGGDQQKLIQALNAAGLEIDYAKDGTVDFESNLSKLAATLTSESSAAAKDYTRILKIRDPNKRDAELKKFKESARNSLAVGIQKSLAGKKQQDQEYSDKIPVISMSDNGKPMSPATKVVPVWVIGFGAINGKDAENEKKQYNEQKSREDEEYLAKSGLADDKNYKRFSVKHQLRKNRRRNRLIKLKNKFDILDLTDQTTYQDDYFKLLNQQLLEQNQQPTTEEAIPTKENPNKRTISPEQLQKMQEARKAKNKKGGGASLASTASVLASYSMDDPSSIMSEIASANKVDEHTSHKAYKKKQKITKDNKFNISTYEDNVSKVAFKIYSNRKFADSDVLPVLDLNVSHDRIEDIADDVKNSRAILSSLNSTVGLIPKLFIGLQEVGLTVNAAAAAGGVAAVGQTVGDLASVGAKYLGSATGSTMRKGKKATSSVITGDALRGTNNKANPELVNVDWNAKKINVTPIPALATGGTATQQKSTSGIMSIDRMTTGERGKPLSVGISSGLVTYSKHLTDVNDDGSQSAVKVYSINSGINDKIKVGDVEISLFDAVYGVFTSVTAVAAGINTTNQLLATIAENTNKISANSLAIAKNSSNGGNQPFVFPSDLDGILAGR